MTSFVGEVNMVYPFMVQACVKEGARVPSRVSDTIEIHPAVCEFVNTRRRLVTSYGRPINVPFALAEVVWILAGRDDVAFLEPFNSNIANYSDDGVRFNSAYGHRLRHAHGFDQLEDVIKMLKRDPGTRQATLTLWHSDDRHHELTHVESHNGGVGDGWDKWVPRETKDRACNLLAHLMIREGRLDWMQVMRSNDAIWGMPYNLMQFTHLQEYVANQVGVGVGSYMYIGDSFHIYDYHEDEAKAIEPFDLYDEMPDRHHSAFIVADNDMEVAQSLATNGWSSTYQPPPCSQWVVDFGQIWASWKAYKDKDDQGAVRCLAVAHDRIYAAATARFYWSNRWHKQDPGQPTRERMITMFGTAVANWITHV